MLFNIPKAYIYAYIYIYIYMEIWNIFVIEIYEVVSRVKEMLQVNMKR